MRTLLKEGIIDSHDVIHTHCYKSLPAFPQPKVCTFGIGSFSNLAFISRMQERVSRVRKEYGWRIERGEAGEDRASLRDIDGANG